MTDDLTCGCNCVSQEDSLHDSYLRQHSIEYVLKSNFNVPNIEQFLKNADQIYQYLVKGTVPNA